MLKILFLLFLAGFIPLAFAESTYIISIDNVDYPVTYSVDAQVLEMAIDKETSSLLIGIKETKDSVMTVTFPDELISATGNQFSILVNGVYADYSFASSQGVTSLTFLVPDFTEEVEIVGTRVVPEFPLGFVLLFGTIVFGVVLFGRLGKNSFRL